MVALPWLAGQWAGLSILQANEAQWNGLRRQGGLRTELRERTALPELDVSVWLSL